MSGNFLSRHELKRNNISRIISRDASVNQWRLLNTFKPTETEKEENHRYHKRSLHVSETERSWMETTSEHLKMFRKKWAKNVGLKGNGMEAICELPEITALQRYHGNSCNWAGSWGGFTEQTFGTVLFCPEKFTPAKKIYTDTVRGVRDKYEVCTCIPYEDNRTSLHYSAR